MRVAWFETAALVDFAGVRVVLDCGCRLASGGGVAATRLRAPALRGVRPESIDAVLLTCATGFSALPLLTERFGFAGRVLATEPVLFAARRTALELATLVRLEGLPAAASLSDCDEEEDGEDFDLHGLPTEAEISACAERVTQVHFGERISLLGSDVCVTAHSAGTELGGAFWVLSTASERVALVGDVCAPAVAPVLARYPLPFDADQLADVDVAVVAPSSPLLSSASTYSFDTALRELAGAISTKISSGGSVLVPCTPMGALYDLLELLAPSLGPRVPVFVVAPSAHDLFRYTAICAEWLHPARAERVFMPSDTFAHTQLIASGALKVFACANGSLAPGSLGSVFKEPCVVFAAHPSCMLGDVLHFISLFGSNSKNLIALVEPPYTDADSVLKSAAVVAAAAAGRPLLCRVASFPLDYRAGAHQLGEALSKAHIRVVASCGCDNLEFDGVDVHQVARLGTLKIPLRRKFVSAAIDADLARNLQTRSLGKDAQIGSISCVATVLDGKYTLRASVRDARQQGQPAEGTTKLAPTSALWGIPDRTAVITAFARRGVKSIDAVDGAGEPGELVLRVVGADNAVAIVTLSCSRTNVVSNSDSLQQLLVGAISEDCLRSFAW